LLRTGNSKRLPRWRFVASAADHSLGALSVGSRVLTVRT